MVIEREISRAIIESEPGSGQEAMARELRKKYEELVSAGFRDPSPLIVQDVVREPSAYSIDGGRIILYPYGRLLLKDDGGKVTEVFLSHTHNKVFGLLVRNAGDVVTYQAISDQVYGPDVDVNADELVKKYVERLRRKLEPGNKKGSRHSIIQNLQGVGYRLRAPVEPIYDTPMAKRFVDIVPNSPDGQTKVKVEEGETSLTSAGDQESQEPNDTTTVNVRPIFQGEGSDRVYIHPDFSYYPELRTVAIEGKPNDLTKTENRLLRKLVENVNHIVDRLRLKEAIKEGASDDSLRIYIRYLRLKIGRRTIRSLKDRGYFLFDPSRLDDLIVEPKKEDNASKPVAYSIDGGRIILYPDGQLQLKDDDGKVTSDTLTLTEGNIFSLFVENAHNVVTRQAISDQVWGPDVDVNADELVKKYVERLRRKLEPGNKKGSRHSIIQNLQGVGYRLIASVSIIDQAPSISQQSQASVLPQE